MQGMPEILKAEHLTVSNLAALVYAPPGMGKTTMLGMLPGKTLILDVDRGTSVLRGVKGVDVVRVSEDLHELTQVYEALKEECPYDNVCIDTITELENIMLTAYGRNGKNDGAPEQSHYNKTQFKIKDLCTLYRSLDTNLIITAWEMQSEFILQSGEKHSQVRPMLSGKGVDKICGLCDIVGRILVNRKDGERYVWLKGTQEVVAKDRIWKREYSKLADIITAPDENKPEPVKGEK